MSIYQRIIKLPSCVRVMTENLISAFLSFQVEAKWNDFNNSLETELDISNGQRVLVPFAGYLSL